MFEKLAARFRSSDTDFRLLVPLLISTMLVQLVTAMVRVTTSYRAVELNLSIVWLGGTAAVPPTQLLFIIGAVVAALTCAVALTIRPGPNKLLAVGDSEIVPVGQIVRIPGLVGVVLAGVILVSASDIIVIYVPLLGAERNIDVHAVGLLLTVRAAFSMVARLFYARMVVMFGRWPLMIASTFACGVRYAAFA